MPRHRRSSRAAAEENRAALDEAMRRLSRALGTPRHLRFPWEAVVLGLGSLIGNLEKLTLRERASTMDLVQDGYECIPGFRPRPRDLVVPQINVQMVVKAVQKQMAVMNEIPVGSHIWVSAMASMLGQLAAVHDVPQDAVRSIIGTAWDGTTQADVDRFQHRKNSVARA